MAKICNLFLFLNVCEGIIKEKINCTLKIARFEEFLVVAEVASFVCNPVYEEKNSNGFRRIRQAQEIFRYV